MSEREIFSNWGRITMAVNALPALPVGVYDFANLRSRGFAYVDKTELLMTLADERKLVTATFVIDLDKRLAV